MGSCQPTLLDQNSEIKVLENPSIAIVSKEATFSEEMPLDILGKRLFFFPSTFIYR